MPESPGSSSTHLLSPFLPFPPLRPHRDPNGTRKIESIFRATKHLTDFLRLGFPRRRILLPGSRSVCLRPVLIRIRSSCRLYWHGFRSSIIHTVKLVIPAIPATRYKRSPLLKDRKIMWLDTRPPVSAQVTSLPPETTWLILPIYIQ